MGVIRHKEGLSVVVRDYRSKREVIGHKEGYKCCCKGLQIPVGVIRHKENDKCCYGSILKVVCELKRLDLC